MIPEKVQRGAEDDQKGLKFGPGCKTRIDEFMLVFKMNVSSWRVQSGARWAYFEIMSIILESWNGFGALGVRSWGTWGSKRPRGGSKKPRGKPTVIIGGLNSGDKGDEGLGWRRTGGKRGGWGKIINARDKSSARPNHAQGIGWRIKNAFCPCRLPPFLSECGTIAMYRL
jgi:hypothetical protein